MSYEVGQVVEGIVTGVQPYGAFVALNEGYSGLVHISELSEGFVKDVQKYLKIDQKIKVSIIDIDPKNKHLKLSIKALKKNKTRVRRRGKQFFYRRRGIVETPSGFTPLAEALPIFIANAEKKIGEM